MKHIFFVLISLFFITSCAGPVSSGGELTGVRGSAWNEPAPYGMTLVKRGYLEMGSSEKDALW